MNFRKFIVELGVGADLHGIDVNTAAQRAIKDAMSHCCMSGLQELLNITEPDKAIHLLVKIACPLPDEIRENELLSLFPVGTPELEIVQGGMMTTGVEAKQFGDGDQIVVVNASITVMVDKDMVNW